MEVDSSGLEPTAHMHYSLSLANSDRPRDILKEIQTSASCENGACAIAIRSTTDPALR